MAVHELYHFPPSFVKEMSYTVFVTSPQLQFNESLIMKTLKSWLNIKAVYITNDEYVAYQLIYM